MIAEFEDSLWATTAIDDPAVDLEHLIKWLHPEYEDLVGPSLDSDIFWCSDTIEVAV
jgi:hypothetical protein